MCFFAVKGGTITVIVFYHGNGLHGGNHRSFTAVKIPWGNPRGKPSGKNILVQYFPVQLTSSRIGNLSQLFHTLLKVMDLDEGGLVLKKRLSIFRESGQRLENGLCMTWSGFCRAAGKKQIIVLRVDLK